MRKKSLAETNPQLAKEWHATKNGNLSPKNVTAGSGKKVWWKCPKGNDHEWEAPPKRRKNNHGCPVCVNQLIVKSNCLATTHPKLAKEWHPTKNGDLTPYDVGAGSNKKVWWKCPKGNDHIWKASIGGRGIRNHGCRICDGKKIVKSNCLATTHPKLAKEWHPTKNGDLTPYDVGAGSGKKVWWKCPKGNDHEWETSISSRKIGQNCSICSGRKVVKSNSLQTLRPEIAKEWHPTKNGNLTPNDVSEKSGKKVWWKCPKGDDHEWETSIASRNITSCPICSGKKVVKSNSLQTLRPEIANEWHPTKNGNLTPNDVTIGTRKKVWWKCPKGNDHIWETKVSVRSRGLNCPICSGQKVVKSNSLRTLRPEIAKEWHPTKNGNLTPNDVTIGTTKKVWWKCPKGNDHIWKASIGGRGIRNHGCPICDNKIAVFSNSLLGRFPKIAKEWHPTKNGDLTPDLVVGGSGKKVWWICPNNSDHDYRTTVGSRTGNMKTGCPTCGIGGFSPSKKGYIYLHLIYHESGEKIGLKFGITNKYGKRIKELMSGLSLYELKNIFYFQGDGKIVFDIESQIKRKYKTGYINKEIMEYGYTETIKYSDKTMVEIYNLCNKKLKFKSGKKLYMKRLVNIFN